ncbi:hypothetical protein FHS89_002575 [Rubricella aquisinus]|uniref:Host specificity protein n=1 Tax=Rubricella aquisinus TaxID=2028108 RepID=A0A840X1B8_9RHOB|nr:glycoside hydrolase/phage tail family protein [Rubricella aquisinus]MBB5516544.1 hypothetical protein [Rubricella aquisinus]
MATVILAAAGAAAGSAVGGAFLGLSSAAIGQAIGATIGAGIDQRLTGGAGGSYATERGRVETFRMQGASEGTALPYVAGRMRLPGQLIWSTRFKETATTSSSTTTSTQGGKGGGGGSSATTTTTTYSYSLSFAVALCSGEITRIGRVWADGKRVDLSRITWRMHPGSEKQDADPLIAAVEGLEDAPSYRGTAYLVFEDLELGPYGNRIPQITAEVVRRPQSRLPETDRFFSTSPVEQIAGVCMIPGTGEYTLSDAAQRLIFGPGSYRMMNVNNELGEPDFVASLGALKSELPAVQSSVLVVSWFGDDLRAGHCTVKPKVEQTEFDGAPMPWRAGGITRAMAETVSQTEGRVNFGGTSADGAVVQAINRMRDEGIAVTFYPFLLMDIPGDTSLPDPWSDGTQAAFPWRGRITTNDAPGRAGTADKTPAAAAEVASFMGAAQITDFTIVADGSVTYAGPSGDWGFRRMILHYAHLCVAAGGVDAFCIGSELRGLTQIRDGASSYPFVTALRALAADVRAILGPEVKIGYAADWSEYFGHHPKDGSGDVLYHLDPLWADANIDFVGIDNYMPLSDWRDGEDHADAAWGSLYNPDYLRANVEGGEGFDWYYATPEDRAAQERTPITDAAHGEDHIFRPKDLRNWWGRPHYDRPGGVRSAQPTEWEAEGKPIWFTEYGCPAIDKGTNQPNVFVDAISSESAMPYFSTGARDDFIQYRYLEAMISHWSAEENNPRSKVYDAPMIEMSRAHVWAWDARPWPDFPNRIGEWSDGPNYARGHWISGRLQMAVLGEVVAELCGVAGIGALEATGLHGGVPGFELRDRTSARAALQPLMLGFGFDVMEQEGALRFRMRDGARNFVLDRQEIVANGPLAALERSRAADGEAIHRVQIEHYDADRDYQRGAVEAALPDADRQDGDRSTMPMAMTAAAARSVAARFLAEAQVSGDRISVTVPPTFLQIEAGDILEFDGQRYRVDRIEDADARRIEGARVDPSVYVSRYFPEDLGAQSVPPIAGPVVSRFLDLPLLRGDEVPHAPHVVATSDPWPGPVRVYSSTDNSGYAPNTDVFRAAVMGHTKTPLKPAKAGLWQWASGLEVEVVRGALESRTPRDVLDGANVAAIRAAGGTDWEVFQFQTAELIGKNTWRLDGLLRGQLGTEFVHDAAVPEGAQFVFLDAAAVQIDIPQSARGLERYYRVGPATRTYDEDVFSTVVEASLGVGLRPYAPVHLTARNSGATLDLAWVRRTRVEGDLWDLGDVPLAEEQERYIARLRKDGAVHAEVETTAPSASFDTASSPGFPFDVEVGQISARWGIGAKACNGERSLCPA